MKKTVVLLLITMPFIMIALISFAARIMSVYTVIRVEGVQFTNSAGVVYESTDIVNVNVGEDFTIYAVVFPTFASNKEVVFTSSKPAVCTIDEEGVITGLTVGTSQIKVQTRDRDKTAQVTVSVNANNAVTGVVIKESGSQLARSGQETVPVKQMERGQQINLTATVETLFTGGNINRSVVWSVEDSSIASVANGTVKAKDVGTTVLTVTTVGTGLDDETFAAQLTIDVVNPADAFYFDVPDGFINITPAEPQTSVTVNLLDLFVNLTGYENIVFKIEKGSSYASLNLENNHMLTITTEHQIIIISAKIPGQSKYVTELEISFTNPVVEE